MQLIAIRGKQDLFIAAVIIRRRRLLIVFADESVKRHGGERKTRSYEQSAENIQQKVICAAHITAENLICLVNKIDTDNKPQNQRGLIVAA